MEFSYLYNDFHTTWTFRFIKMSGSPFCMNITQNKIKTKRSLKKIQSPTENFISKFTLFSLLSKCSNRGIQTTLGEYMPHLSRDMFWSLCLFLHMKGNGYLLKCQSFMKNYFKCTIEPKVLCSRVCIFYDFNDKKRILVELKGFVK